MCQMSVFSFRSKSVSDTVQQYLSDECIFFRSKSVRVTRTATVSSIHQGFQKACLRNYILSQTLSQELMVLHTRISMKSMVQILLTKPDLVFLMLSLSLCEINSLRTYLLLVSLCFDLAFVSVHVLSNECAKWDKLRHLKYFII